MNGLPVDLSSTPFSRRGSFFAVSDVGGGVHLRTVRGGARHREVLRFDVGEHERSHVDAGRLELTGATGVVEVALAGTGTALLRVRRGTLVLDLAATMPYDVVVPESDTAWRFVDSGAVRNYRIALHEGGAAFDAHWDGVRNTGARLTVTGPALVVVEEFGSSVVAGPAPDVEEVVAAARDDFEAWCTVHSPTVATDLQEATRLALFVTWAALVPAGGTLRRESMLMSKNDMAHVWSWDHCFNALALWRDPTAAADQFLTLFDHQDAFGCLPDHVDDAGVQFNFVKPPVHGWTVDRLLDRGGLPDDVVDGLFGPLAAWTDWWFTHRDLGGDGIPSYQHGNDSGWDNSTVFAEGIPVQSPDLMAFLVLQLHTVARLADRSGRDGAPWRDRADATLETLVATFWRGDRFVARNSLTGADIPSDSLLTLLPLVLGDLLPAAQFGPCVERLRGFLTPFGPATELLDSPHHVDDGYWRGPVWAPTTLLLVDGLRRGGEEELAAEIAANFVATCAAGGMAENFSASTGAGLRDRSMTWTASVFLLLTEP